MGMDSVELILAIEDSFQISVDDSEASAAVTVGQLRDLILSKLDRRDAETCLSMTAFHALRRSIIPITGWQRRDIRPSTPLNLLLPASTRKASWSALEAAINLKLPRLQHPGYVWISFGCTLLGTVILALALFFLYKRNLSWMVGALFAECLGLYVFIKVTPYLETNLSTGSTDLGGLAKDILALNHAKLAEKAKGWTEAEVWTSLCRLIEFQLGVKAERITPNAKFIDDLGLA